VVAFQNCLGAGFVLRIGVAVEEQNRGRLDAQGFDAPPKRGDFLLVERLVDVCVRQHALLHLEAQRALDQWHVFPEEEVVGVRPVDAADLIDVTKACGDQQRGFRAGPFQDGVDGYRRAMQEQPR
jgi:hypothetical protein